jgi:hypothetical protein
MIHDDIRKGIPQALKAHEELRLSVLRGLVTAFVNELVTKRRKPTEDLTDEEAIEVIKRAAKQRKDSIEQFRAGKREDLAQKEEKELTIIETLLPAMMPREEIEKIARAKKEELGITDPAQKGKFMGTLMQELRGKADGADVRAVVDNLF